MTLDVIFFRGSNVKCFDGIVVDGVKVLVGLEKHVESQISVEIGSLNLS